MPESSPHGVRQLNAITEQMDRASARMIPLRHGGEVRAETGPHGHCIMLRIPMRAGGALSIPMSKEDALDLVRAIQVVAGAPVGFRAEGG